MMRISVHGLGYVGSVTAASLVKLGHEVIGVDVNPAKVAAINAGRSPLGEPGLAELIREVRATGRLRATTSLAEAVANSDVALLCVGTPTAPKGGPDLTALERVGEEIGRALAGRNTPFTVVLRSTVLPGTTEGALASALAKGGASCELHLADNPEFMREGCALRDFMHPPFTVLGCTDAATEKLLRELYAGIDAPVVATSIPTAEALKLVCNAFHALKVTFTNEVAALCSALGADADDVMRVFAMDHKLNVSEAYLRPGYAFGGSCLPKDVRALNHVARMTGVEAPLMASIISSNEGHKARGVNAVLAAGKRKVGLVGLAFKPDSDDLRESPLVSLVQALIAHGCDVRIYDLAVSSAKLVGVNRRWQEEHLPNMASMMCKSIDELLAHADVLVIGHNGPDAEQALREARRGAIVVDLTHGVAEPVVLRRPAAPGRRRLQRAAAHVALGVVMLIAAGVARAGEIALPEGGDLQAAIDHARPGDTLVLEAGASYVGPFTLPAKSGDGWITIRGPRPVESGERARPTDAAKMPKLVAASGPIVRAAPRAHHYRLEGIELRPTSGTFLYNLVELGDAAMSASEVPHDFVIAACYLHGDPAAGTRRGIALNSASTRVVDSYFADFKERGADSQAIAGWAGPGPFAIVNNYLEAAGENIMFGGGDPPTRDRIPSDIEIRGNHVAKPLAWKRGPPWTVKNLLELKDARRVVIEGNLFEHVWPAAQTGFAILFTVRNQDGTAPWSTIEDVVFRGNIVRDAAGGMNLLGHDDAHDSGQGRRITIRDNLLVDIAGTLFQLLDGTVDLTIEHNIGLQGGNAITADGKPHTGFVFRDNVVRHNQYGVIGSGKGVGAQTLAAYFPGARMTKNVLAGGRGADYPSGNYFPSSLDGVIVVDGDLVRLAAKSPYRGAGSDGRDLGADLNLLRTALQAARP